MFTHVSKSCTETKDRSGSRWGAELGLHGDCKADVVVLGPGIFHLRTSCQVKRCSASFIDFSATMLCRWRRLGAVPAGPLLVREGGLPAGAGGLRERPQAGAAPPGGVSAETTVICDTAQRIHDCLQRERQCQREVQVCRVSTSMCSDLLCSAHDEVRECYRRAWRCSARCCGT